MIWVGAVIVMVVVAMLFYIRQQFGLFAAMVLMIIGAIISFFASGESRKQITEKQSVSATATATGEVCVDPSLPVAVSLENNSDRRVKRLAFTLTGSPQGQTSIVYQAFLRDEQVIDPGDGVTRCYGLLHHGFSHPRPQIIDGTKYDWQVRITLIDFDSAPN